MSKEDDALKKGMLAHPVGDLTHFVMADRLEERGKSGAEIIRLASADAGQPVSNPLAPAEPPAAPREVLAYGVSAYPDDDEFRLAYARFMASNNQAAVGEFIRVQVERADLDPASERAGELREREWQLLHDPQVIRYLEQSEQELHTFYHYSTAARQIGEAVQNDDREAALAALDTVFDRGFCYGAVHIQCPEGTQLFSPGQERGQFSRPEAENRVLEFNRQCNQPVTELVIHNDEHTMQPDALNLLDLRKHPIRILTLSNYASDEFVSQMMQNAYLGQTLEEIKLSHAPDSQEMAEALGGENALPRLQRLTLSTLGFRGNEDWFILSLADAPALKNVIIEFEPMRGWHGTDPLNNALRAFKNVKADTLEALDKHNQAAATAHGDRLRRTYETPEWLSTIVDLAKKEKSPVTPAESITEEQGPSPVTSAENVSGQASNLTKKT